MRTIFSIVGIVTSIHLAYTGIQYAINDIELIRKVLVNIGVLTVVLGPCLLLLIYVRRRIQFHIAWNIVLGQDLSTAIKNFVEELPNISQKSIATVTGAIVGRLFRVGVLGISLAIIPVVLLFIQNSKIENQNQLIKTQSELLESQVQTNRVEAVSNVLDLIAIDNDMRTNFAINQMATLGKDALPVMHRIASMEMPYSNTAWRVLLNQAGNVSADDVWNIFEAYVRHVNRQFTEFTQPNSLHDSLNIREIKAFQTFVNNVKSRTTKDQKFLNNYLCSSLRAEAIEYVFEAFTKINVSQLIDNYTMKMFIVEADEFITIASNTNGVKFTTKDKLTVDLINRRWNINRARCE